MRTSRRAAMAVLAFTLLTAPLAAKAQQPGKVYRLGILSPASPTSGSYLLDVLRELGYAEGRNLEVERRYADGHIERLPGLAAELVKQQVDVMIAVSPVAAEAAREATKTIPIVILFAGSDPVELKLVASLARPGGNVTGVALSAGTLLAGKRLELLREAVPRATRIAVLVTDEPSGRAQAQESERAATTLGFTLIVVEVKGRDYERAFATMQARRAGALFVSASAVLNSDRKQIIELAARHRLPAMYQWPEHVDDGGLIAYGSSNRGLNRRVAIFVDRIFKGAKPADLPVEQPTTFELAINLKTAKALGLTIPPSVLTRADQVVE